MDVEILPATADRFDDAEHALTGGGDGAGCQCQWWMLPNAEYRATTPDERADMLRTELGETPSPGLVAYVDGAAAGWVRVGPRPAQLRLARNRDVVATSPESSDDGSVWVVSCFSVRKEHRRSGLMSALLDAAVAHARDGGARVVEGYPFDLSAGKRGSNEMYRGVLSVFKDAGFEVVGRIRPDRPVVSLTLRGEGA